MPNSEDEQYQKEKFEDEFSGAIASVADLLNMGVFVVTDNEHFESVADQMLDTDSYDNN